ncbi:MAG: hypothetical protein AB8B55_10225 [Mariniblastus sp.]
MTVGLLLLVLLTGQSENGFAQQTTTIPAVESLAKYRDYFDQISTIEFSAQYTSRKTGNAEPGVRLMEDWRIDFNKKSLWKKTTDTKSQEYFSELVLDGDHLYGMTVKASDNTAADIFSWSVLPEGYWYSLTGFGDTGALFGIAWNGTETYRIEEFIKFGETSIEGKIATVVFESETCQFHATFDTEKGFCPIEYELVRELDEKVIVSDDRTIRQHVLFMEPKKVSDVWIPHSITVNLASAKRKHFLPEGQLFSNGSIISTSAEIPGAQNYMVVPASSVESKVVISNVRVGGDPKFEIEASLEKGMPVAMQDVPYLPHIWNGNEAVAKIDGSFEEEASLASFESDASVGIATTNQSPASLFLLLSSLLVGVAACCYVYKSLSVTKQTEL